jgi:hypothetical protein
MKIRNRLTASISVAVFVVFLAFSCTVYFFSAEYRTSEFYNRLNTRVEITEKIFLESENSPEFRAIQAEFLNKLPMETEEVVELVPSFMNNLSLSYPEEFIKELLINKEASFEHKQRQGVGRVFHVNGRDQPERHRLWK